MFSHRRFRSLTHGRGSWVVDRGSSVVGRRSSVVGRRSSVVGRGSWVQRVVGVGVGKRSR